MSEALEVGSREDLVVERAASGGAVARSATGQVVFVRHALPGETVRAEITELTKSFARADAVEILTESPARVVVPCPHAGVGRCGGCDLQHASVEAQLSWKSSVLSEHLRRTAGIEMAVSVVPATHGAAGSRTRIRCAVDAAGQLGFRRHRSHDVAIVNECWLGEPRLARAFDSDWQGFDEVELRAIGEGEPFAVARRDDGDEIVYEVVSLDGEALPVATCSTVDVDGHRFRVSPLSFWQSHSSAPQWLMNTVIELLGAQPGDHVADLYSGVGLFAVALAQRVGRTGRVTALEISEDSALDAQFNAVGLSQLKVRKWSVAPRSINDAVGAGDLVVMDPPRAGAGKSVMNSLVKRRPRRIVYVSCDGATFARDVRAALDGGYSLSDLRARDFFPMTEHVEIVGVLDAAS